MSKVIWNGKVYILVPDEFNDDWFKKIFKGKVSLEFMQDLFSSDNSIQDVTPELIAKIKEKDYIGLISNHGITAHYRTELIKTDLSPTELLSINHVKLVWLEDSDSKTGGHFNAEDFLRKRGYVLNTKYWSKGFTYVKSISSYTFKIGHTIPRNKGCKVRMKDLESALNYFERL